MEAEAESVGAAPAAQATPAAAPVAARSIAVDTPVAKPVPKRNVITRRIFILGGFWSAIGLLFVGIFGSPLDFMWIRKITGFGGPVPVSPDRVPRLAVCWPFGASARTWAVPSPGAPTLSFRGARAGSDVPVTAQPTRRRVESSWPGLLPDHWTSFPSKCSRTAVSSCKQAAHLKAAEASKTPPERYLTHLATRPRTRRKQA